METEVLGFILLGLLFIAVVPLQNQAYKEGGFSIFNVGAILLNVGALGVAVACFDSDYLAWIILMQLADFTARPFDEQPAKMNLRAVLRKPRSRSEAWICWIVVVFMTVFLVLVASNLFGFREGLATLTTRVFELPKALPGLHRYEDIFILFLVVGCPVVAAAQHLDPRKWMQVMWCAAAMGLAWLLALVTQTPVPSLSVLRLD